MEARNRSRDTIHTIWQKRLPHVFIVALVSFGLLSGEGKIDRSGEVVHQTQISAISTLDSNFPKDNIEARRLMEMDLVPVATEKKKAVIAIIDTGIDVSSNFFENRIVDEACFSVGQGCQGDKSSEIGVNAAQRCDVIFDRCAHGTAMASIIKTVTVHADILPIQHNGVDDIISAINYLSKKPSGEITAANMSFGWLPVSNTDCTAGNARFVESAKKLVAHGTVIVGAGGNYGDKNSVIWPWCSHFGESRDDGVFVVASTDSQYEGLSDMTNFFPHFTSLATPGEANGLWNGDWSRLSGTSVSTALMSAFVGDFMQRYPDMSPSEIEKIVRKTGALKYDEKNDVYFLTPRMRSLLLAKSEKASQIFLPNVPQFH